MTDDGDDGGDGDDDFEGDGDGDGDGNGDDNGDGGDVDGDGDGDDDGDDGGDDGDGDDGGDDDGDDGDGDDGGDDDGNGDGGDNDDNHDGGGGDDGDGDDGGDDGDGDDGGDDGGDDDDGNGDDGGDDGGDDDDDNNHDGGGGGDSYDGDDHVWCNDSAYAGSLAYPGDPHTLPTPLRVRTTSWAAALWSRWFASRDWNYPSPSCCGIPSCVVTSTRASCSFPASCSWCVARYISLTACGRSYRRRLKMTFVSNRMKALRSPTPRGLGAVCTQWLTAWGQWWRRKPWRWETHCLAFAGGGPSLLRLPGFGGSRWWLVGSVHVTFSIHLGKAYTMYCPLPSPKRAGCFRVSFRCLSGVVIVTSNHSNTW